MTHFAWASYNYVCGACNHVLVLDHRSYEKEKLARIIVFCRNENCDHFRTPYQLDTEQLKIPATPYGSATNKRESGSTQGTNPGPGANS